MAAARPSLENASVSAFDCGIRVQFTTARTERPSLQDRGPPALHRQFPCPHPSVKKDARGSQPEKPGQRNGDKGVRRGDHAVGPAARRSLTLALRIRHVISEVQSEPERENAVLEAGNRRYQPSAGANAGRAESGSANG